MPQPKNPLEEPYDAETKRQAARRQEVLARLIGEMSEYDKLGHVILKGHLLVEEELDGIVGSFVFHPVFIDKLQLSFANLVGVARSMSLDESKNSMWDLIMAINALRNGFSHRYTPEQRKAKLDRVFELYDKERDPSREEPHSAEEHVRIFYAVGLCLGFLIGFREEVDRFKGFVAIMDATVNPQRHGRKPAIKGSVEERDLKLMVAETLAILRAKWGHLLEAEDQAVAEVAKVTASEKPKGV